MKRFIATALTGGIVIVGVYFLPRGTWASLGQLPLHPLIVHGVVVLLPLLGIAILPLLFNRRWLSRLHYIVLITLAMVTVAVLAAASSGNSLAAAVGLPEEHANWGNTLVFVAMGLYGAFVIYIFFAIYLPSKALSQLLSAVVGIIAISSVVLTVLVGHSGATAVWESKYASSKVPIALSQDEFVMADVQKHATPNDCWTVIEGNVYEMTSFINRHPDGAKAITRLCGRDGTRDFNREHSGQNEPKSWLDTLLIGTLKS